MRAWTGIKRIVKYVYRVKKVAVIVAGWRLNPADWQFDNKFSTLRLIILDPDEAMMIRNNAVDNSQTETGPVFLRRKIGLEQSRAVCGRNTMAIVGNDTGGHL